jgi:hypothetical protein
MERRKRVKIENLIIQSQMILMRKIKNWYPRKPVWLLRAFFLMSSDLNEMCTKYEGKNI